MQEKVVSAKIPPGKVRSLTAKAHFWGWFGSAIQFRAAFSGRAVQKSQMLEVNRACRSMFSQPPQSFGWALAVGEFRRLPR
jgi:hypothetical protein